MRICIVLDTSASMLCPIGPSTGGSMTLLDAAKNAVEQFVSVRSRIPAARNDHYILVTCQGVQAGHAGSDSAAFLEALKMTRVGSIADFSAAVAAAFDIVNRQRPVQIENYCQGRVPWFIDPSAFIMLTDGGRDIPDTFAKLRRPPPPPSAALVNEMYRWDHRVHVVHLSSRLSQPPQALVDLCSQTCGSFKPASTVRSAIQVMEGLAARIAPSVVVRLTSAADPKRSAAVALAIVQDKGNWPIPLSYLPEADMAEIPTTNAIPVFTYKPLSSPVDLATIGVPYDKYDVEGGQLPPAVVPEGDASQSVLHAVNSLGNGSDGRVSHVSCRPDRAVLIAVLSRLDWSHSARLSSCRTISPVSFALCKIPPTFRR